MADENDEVVPVSGMMTPEEIETFVPPEEDDPEGDARDWMFDTLMAQYEELLARVLVLERILGLRGGDGAVIESTCVEVRDIAQITGRTH